MFRMLCIFLNLIIYFRCISGLEIDHWGTHFVLSFLKNYDSPIENVVVITTREKTDVRVSSFETAGQILEFSLDALQSHRINFAEKTMITTFYRVLEKKAVLIESSTKISVYGFSYSTTHNSADGFLVLPIPSLGLEYMAVNLDDGAQLAVIAVEDVTTIRITQKGPNKCSSDGIWTKFADGFQHTFNMDAYDVISMYCAKHMTGSLVSSDKPVAILTGNECVSLPSTASCDHVVEMLPPVNQFGNEFVVVPPYGHSYDATLRVVAVVDDTTFFIKSNEWALAAGSYTDFVIIPYDNICFRSSKPVMAVIFMRGPSKSVISNYRGDAFMMYTPPTQKYTTQYVFDANALEPYTKWAIVIMRDIFKSAITPSIPNIQLINNCWSYSKDIIGVDELIHYSSNNPFGVLMYGYDNREAYGYPAGMKLTDYSEVEECANSPCQNGGWCLEVGLSYRCHCLTGFTGDHCELDAVDDCLPGPCNQGSCVDGFQRYTCNCMIGYTGVHCETALPTAPPRPAKQQTIDWTKEKPTTTVPTTADSTTTVLTTAEPITTALTTDEPTSVPTTTDSTTPALTTEELTTTIPTIEPKQSELTKTFTEITEKLPTEVTATTTVVTSSTGAPFIPKPLFLKPPCYDQLCMCQCPCAIKPHNKSDAELLTRTQLKLMLLAKETLSKTKRLKCSWPNVNQSEITLGSSAIIILMMFILLILLLDISKICKECFKKFSDYQETEFV